MRHDRQAQDHRTAQQRAFEWACKAEDGIPPSPGAMRELAIMWAAVAGALDPEPVDLEPQTSEPAPDTLDAEDETADTWAVPHEVHLVHQVESRPGPPDADGARWMERRKTGLADWTQAR